jgi:hypothetical protein
MDTKRGLKTKRRKSQLLKEQKYCISIPEMKQPNILNVLNQK